MFRASSARLHGSINHKEGGAEFPPVLMFCGVKSEQEVRFMFEGF